MVSSVQALTGLIGCALLAFGLITGEPSSEAETSSEGDVILAQDAPTPEVHRPSTIMPPTPSQTPVSGEEVVSDASLDPDSATVYRVCRVTAYCDRGITASGVPSGIGQCAAPADIPFGSLVYIPALGRGFRVTDRTHRRFRRSTVDIFIPTRGRCLEFGCRYLEVEITLPEDA